MTIAPHPSHPRLRRIELSPAELQSFFAAACATDVQRLEYVPYARFVLAQQLDQAGGGGLRAAARAIAGDRASGGFTLAAGAGSADDYVRLATAVAHLLGPANFDAMGGTYYARFRVQHEDDSDSYLRQAYVTMTLHTDGTYVDEQTDWILLMKLAERDAAGGESRLLHLDDWEELERFASHPLAAHEFLYKSPPSKNVSTSVRRRTFFERDGRPCLCYIDQFAHPESIEQGLYLDALTRSMENSPGTATVALPVGELIVLNNGFWAHGRAPFVRNRALQRELLRERGSFAAG